MNFRNLSIGVKLPMSFALVTLAVVTITAFLAHNDFRKALTHEANTRLDVMVYERSQSIATWFEMIRDRVAVFGHDQYVVDAVKGMGATFGLLMDDPVADLQAAYIHNNPHPIGEKDLLDQADTNLPYNFQHAKHHPFFRDVKNGLELYDIFIFNLDGDLIYSVYKEADFATNFIDGDYSNSGLGTAFRRAVDSDAGSVHFVDFTPYEPSANAPASFMATPITSGNGTTIGVFAIQLPSDLIDHLVNHPEGQGQTGEMTLIATDNMARTNSRFEDGHLTLGALELPQHIADSIDNGGGFFVDMPGLNGKPAVSALHDVEILGETWHMLAEVETSEVFQSLYIQRNKTVLVSTIAIMVSALVAWLLSRSVTQPVISVTESMTKVGNRDYNIDTSGSNRGDEVGSLYRALETMSERSQEFDERVESEKQLAAAQEFAVQELGTALKHLARKDFSREISTPFAPQFEALRTDFNVTLQDLNATMSQLIQFSKMIETQTQKMSSETSQLSNRTENQAATLEETAAAVDQITGHVKTSSGELKSAEQLVLETNDKAINGQKVLNKTSKAMTEIENSSEEIRKIVGVVDDIAFQTNLLALNAGVEAARAGEAGRGFAVVATEVRQLAQRATDSVSQISSLIENSGRAVAQGVTLVGNTDEALIEIVERIESISSLIMSVTASSSEQSDGLAEINIGVSQLDQATQQNASMVDQSSHMAQQLKSEALNLVSMLEGFELLTKNNVEPAAESVQLMKDSERNAA